MISISLALDCFTIAICSGCTNNLDDKRYVFRLAFHFGLFQAGMTIFGWFAGKPLLQSLSSIDHWIVFGLLAFTGFRMILSGLDKGKDKSQKVDPSRGVNLIILSLATSIDALAVGLSLALLEANIIYASLMIGLVSTVLTIFGSLIGHRLRNRFGKRIEVLGGLILISIGFNVVYSHLSII